YSRSLCQREYDTGRYVCAVRPALAGSRFNLESHAADFDLPRQRVADGNVDTGADSLRKLAGCRVSVRCRRRKVSDPNARQCVGRKLGGPISRFSPKHIGDECDAASKAVDAHVVFQSPRSGQIKTSLVCEAGMATRISGCAPEIKQTQIRISHRRLNLWIVILRQGRNGQ